MIRDPKPPGRLFRYSLGTTMLVVVAAAVWMAAWFQRQRLAELHVRVAALEPVAEGRGGFEVAKDRTVALASRMSAAPGAWEVWRVRIPPGVEHRLSFTGGPGLGPGYSADAASVALPAGEHQVALEPLDAPVSGWRVYVDADVVGTIDNPVDPTTHRSMVDSVGDRIAEAPPGGPLRLWWYQPVEQPPPSVTAWRQRDRYADGPGAMLWIAPEDAALPASPHWLRPGRRWLPPVRVYGRREGFRLSGMNPGRRVYVTMPSLSHPRFFGRDVLMGFNPVVTGVVPTKLPARSGWRVSGSTESVTPVRWAVDDDGGDRTVYLHRYRDAGGRVGQPESTGVYLSMTFPAEEPDAVRFGVPDVPANRSVTRLDLSWSFPRDVPFDMVDFRGELYPIDRSQSLDLRGGGSENALTLSLSGSASSDDRWRQGGYAIRWELDSGTEGSLDWGSAPGGNPEVRLGVDSPVGRGWTLRLERR